MNPTVSIIIPVYNVEKYLDECLNSVVNQTFKDIEIILVDDGSKDTSGIKCDEWKLKDSRITVIHKQNAGLGFARNSGLEVASGEYVEFLDSDDYLELNTVETFLNEIKRNNADVVLCDFKRFDETGIEDSGDNRVCKVFTKDKIINEVMLEMVGTLPNQKKDCNFRMSSCMAMYSLKLIKDGNIRFKSEREYISEDLLFNLDVCQLTNVIVSIPNKLYYYRKNPNSLTRIYNPNRFEKNKKMYEYLFSYLSEYLDISQFKVRLQRYLLSCARVCIRQVSFSNEKKKFKLINEILSDPLIREIVKDYPYKDNPAKQKIFNFFIKTRNVLACYILCRAKR